MSSSKESTEYVRKKSNSMGDNDVSHCDVINQSLSSSFNNGTSRKGVYPFGMNDKLTRLLLANETTKAMSSSYSSNISNFINSTYTNCGSNTLNIHHEYTSIRSPTLSMADITVVVPEGISPCLDDSDDVIEEVFADQLPSQVVETVAEEQQVTSKSVFSVDDSGYSESDPSTPNESSPELPRSQLTSKSPTLKQFDTVSLSSSSMDSHEELKFHDDDEGAEANWQQVTKKRKSSHKKQQRTSSSEELPLSDTSSSRSNRSCKNRSRTSSRSSNNRGPGTHVHTVTVNKHAPRLSTKSKVSDKKQAPPARNNTVEFPPFITSSLTSSSTKLKHLVASSEASVPSFLMPDECHQENVTPTPDVSPLPPQQQQIQFEVEEDVTQRLVQQNVFLQPLPVLTTNVSVSLSLATFNQPQCCFLMSFIQGVFFIPVFNLQGD